MKRGYILLGALLGMLVSPGGCAVKNFQGTPPGQQMEIEKETEMEMKFTAQQLQILEKEFENFVKEYHIWLLKNQFYGVQDVYLYSEKGIEQLTDYNYTDNREKYTTANSFARLRESGEIIGGDVIREEREENE